MKKILLIEDNDEIRENTAEILELSNYKVFTASNGKSGVEVALEQMPDLIICDIMMPVLDGYGVLHMLHKNPQIQDTPFIFLTAKTERADLRKGMELGADDYLTKPFNGTDLLNAVEGRFRKKELLKKELPPDLKGLDQLIETAAGKDALSSLAAHRSINKFRRKQLIYAEGNHPAWLFYIVKGKIRTFKSNEDGKELVVGLYKEGDFFGYIALIKESLYRETAEALEDSEIAQIPRSEFEELIHNNHEVAQKFIKMLANNISDKEQELLGLAYNSLRKKVAETLMKLCRKYENSEGRQFSINVSRENLASMAGTATQSLIRTLSDFKDENLIDIKGGNIILLNQKKLENLLN